ncbi:Uncharacterised protein [Xylophilus ampelinus]|nr:Uncharacterised protein [Xylophilus ampelinus]
MPPTLADHLPAVQPGSRLLRAADLLAALALQAALLAFA